MTASEELDAYLEKLSSAASGATLSSKEWHKLTSGEASEKWKANRENNAAFIRAFNPETCLLLLTAIDRLREQRDETIAAYAHGHGADSLDAEELSVKDDGVILGVLNKEEKDARH